MDLETENRIASILMKEAAELRRNAEKDGVHVYLRQSNVRGRPNSRFLTATVLGVQQANRAVEVNEMWRLRQKEQELDEMLKGRRRDESSSDRSHRDFSHSQRSTSKRLADSERKASASCSSSEREIQDCYLRDDKGLRDDEVEEFLHSRVKRGRGTVGSRMDETGPYPPPCPDSMGVQLEGVGEKWEHRVVLGPEKPSTLKYYESSEEESLGDRQKKAKRVGSSKQHSMKHRSKEKSKDKKKKRREDKKRCKHRK